MRAALIAMALAVAAAAEAQTPPAAAPDLPPVDRRLPAHVDAWIAANVVPSGFRLFDRDAESAYLVRLASDQDMGPTTVRAWLRVEYLDPPTKERRIRSAAALYDVDCANPRVRYLAADTYPELNRGGERIETRDEASPEWKYPRPGHFEEAMLEAVCAARAQRLAKEGPVFIPAEP